MAWTITNGATTYKLLGSSVMRMRLRELDQAQIQCTGTYTEDVKVTIKNHLGIPVFIGYVKESEQEENQRVYKLTVTETAIELKDKIVEYSGSRSFIRSSQTVQSLVTLILTGTGWNVGTTDSTVVTSLGFYNTNALSALFKLLQDMQGKYIWFVDNGTTKTVYWGTQRTDRTGTPITYLTKKEVKDSNDRNITKVTVYGADDSYVGSAGSGTKEKIYRYATAKTNAECTDVATKLLADYGSPRRRYTVKLPPDFTYEIGDKVKVDGTDYIVRDIETTQSGTSLGIGAYEISYQDILGNKLEEIKGTVAVGSDATWDGGWQNVASAPATITQFKLPIKDINMISNFILKLESGAFRKDVTTPSTTDNLSAPSLLGTNCWYDLVETVYNGGSTYLPYDGANRYIKSGTLTTGCDHATIILTTNAVSRTVQGMTYFRVEYGYTTTGSPPGAGSWNSIPNSSEYLNTVITSGGTSPVPMTAVTVVANIPGTDTANSTLYVRVYVYSYYSGGGGVDLRYNTAVLQITPRHTHPLPVQTDDTADVGTAPTQYEVSIINPSLWTTYTFSGSPLKYSLDITSQLVTGDNYIRVRTHTAGIKGSINATGTYQTLGKS